MKKDLRHAIRLFRNRPAFTIIAVLTIALGIGVNTAIFSIVNGVLLRPLPFPDSDRLSAIFTVLRGADLDIFSPSNFLDVQAQSTTLESVAVFSTLSFDLSAGTEPQAVTGARVSADFFRVLGVQPVLGRTFTAKDDIPGNDRVVVLSHSIWKERFNRDPGIIGRDLTMNSVPFQVIGVLPEHAEYPENARIWAPIAFTEEEKGYRGSIYLDMIGRLKKGIALDAARQELKLIAERLEKNFPQTNRGISMTAMPLAEALVGDVRLPLLVLAAAVGFVLLIACGNLANLLVANASSRTREFAVRSALGASRIRLLRQLLTESLLLSLTGGALGALFAFWSLPAMRALSPAQLPRIQEITIDGQVLFFTLIISVLTGVLFGLAPAFGFSHPDLQSSLKEGTRSAGSPQSRRLGNTLIVIEVGLVLVLLTGAGLMIRSFSKLISVHPGFHPANLVSFQLTLPESRYPERAHRLAFTKQMIDRLKGQPGTESVAVVQPSPFSGVPEVHDVKFRVAGRPEPDPGEYPVGDITRITPGYFKTMGIPLLRGRDFTDQDSGEDSVRVMIISETLAKSFFATEDPIGQKIVLGRSTLNPVICEIVGVAADIKHRSLNAAIRPEVYISYLQLPSPNFAVITKTVRSNEFISTVKSILASIDRNLAVRFLAPLENLIGQTTAPARASMILISGFAALALLLAVIGLYGLIAYSATQRTREIGIRVALGAQRQNILSLILKKGMLLTVLGTVIGILTSLALTRWLRSLLFQVSPTDVSVFLAVSFVLILTAFIACYIPARRASRIDPIVALRYE